MARKFNEAQYVYLGKEPIRIRVKDRQDKITVMPGEQIISSLNPSFFLSYGFNKLDDNAVKRLDGQKSGLESQISMHKEIMAREVDKIKQDAEARIATVKEKYQHKIDMAEKQLDDITAKQDAVREALTDAEAEEKPAKKTKKTKKPAKKNSD